MMIVLLVALSSAATILVCGNPEEEDAVIPVDYDYDEAEDAVEAVEAELISPPCTDDCRWSTSAWSNCE